MFAILPFLQALSIIIALWGAVHTPTVIDTTVTYGAFGEDGTSLAEWMNSVVSLVGGASGFVGTWLYQRKKQTTFFIALTAWLSKPTDLNAVRQLAFVSIDWFQEYIVTRYADQPEPSAWWKTTLDNIKQELATLPVVNTK